MMKKTIYGFATICLVFAFIFLAVFSFFLLQNAQLDKLPILVYNLSVLLDRRRTELGAA